LSLFLHYDGHFSTWTWVSRYQDVSIQDFIGAKDDGDGVDNWNYRMCKAPLKQLALTDNTELFYGSDALPVTQPACL